MELTEQSRNLSLADARKGSNSHWKEHFAGWQKVNVYDQTDIRRKIILDSGFCVGCAVANAYQGVTGELGEYAQSLYETAKRMREGHLSEKGGVTIPEVADVATIRFGGGWLWLPSFEDALDWLSVKSPLVASFPWTMGMHHPVGRGGWFKRHFGPRWMNPAGPRLSYHATAIMATSPKAGGYVVVENSYGLQWGVKGTARLSWDDLKALIDAKKVGLWGFDWNWRGGGK